LLRWCGRSDSCIYSFLCAYLYIMTETYRKWMLIMLFWSYFFMITLLSIVHEDSVTDSTSLSAIFWRIIFCIYLTHCLFWNCCKGEVVYSILEPYISE
jgi:hypothetical protein